MINQPKPEILRTRSGIVHLYAAGCFVGAAASRLPELRGGVSVLLWLACGICGAALTIAVTCRVASAFLETDKRSWLESFFAFDVLAAAVLVHVLLIGGAEYFIFRLVGGYRGLPLSACLASAGLVLMGTVFPERYLRRRGCEPTEHQAEPMTRE